MRCRMPKLRTLMGSSSVVAKHQRKGIVPLHRDDQQEEEIMYSSDSEQSESKEKVRDDSSPDIKRIVREAKMNSTLR